MFYNIYIKQIEMMAVVSLPESNLPLNFDSLQEHLQTIHDECERLVKKKSLKNEDELDQKIGTLKIAILTLMDTYQAYQEDVRLIALTGATERLDVDALYKVFKNVFKDPNLGKKPNLTAQLRLCKKAYALFTVRNHFFDLFKKLPPDEKHRFEAFISLHEQAMLLLQKEYDDYGIDEEIAALPWASRKAFEALAEIAMRSN